MATASPRLVQDGLRTACSCTSRRARPFVSPPRRYQSTSTSSSKPQRIVAAALLSRPPLILPPLTPLEKTYYAYQRSISRALGKPLERTTEWFFKKGSTAEGSFLEWEKGFKGETGLEEGNEAEVKQKQVQDDERSLERKLDRTLYLLLKKDRKDNAWQFPQGGVESNESLLEAASRELIEETGPNLDVWPIGKVPAASYSYPFPSSHLKKHPGHSGAAVFFLPFRVLRGTPVPNKEEGLVDYAWLSKEEVKGRVSKGYWEAVEPALSEL